jgi:hypothetical protein
MRLYIMTQRKTEGVQPPDSWKETHWERFDFVECGIFYKSDAKLTEDDLKNWVPYYGKEPEGWIAPGPVNAEIAKLDVEEHEKQLAPQGLQWSETSAPDSTCSEYYTVAETSMGTLKIRWKAWKEALGCNSFLCEFPWEGNKPFIVYDGNLDQMKAEVQKEWNKKANEMQTLVKEV